MYQTRHQTLHFVHRIGVPASVVGSMHGDGDIRKRRLFSSTPRTWTLEGHQDCSVKNNNNKKVSRSLSSGLPAIWPVGTYGSHHRRRRAGWAKRQKQPVTVRLASRFGPQLNWPNFLLLIVVIAGQKYLELLFDRSLGCFKRVVTHGPRVL